MAKLKSQSLEMQGARTRQEEFKEFVVDESSMSITESEDEDNSVATNKAAILSSSDSSDSDQEI
jgi:uncharacterized protein YfdQ (DUF2303 family)